jgi:hypothetical protein
VSTESGASPRPGRAPSASACEPYRELIVEALGRGRNAMAIWQALVDGHGFPARYASVRRFVAALRQRAASDAHVVITTAPGEEGQGDYGAGPMARHPKTGKYRRTRLFVLTLEYSRKSIRLLVWQLALLTAAHRVGPSVGAVADHIHRHERTGGVRRILGVLALAKKYGPAVVEDAAKAPSTSRSRRTASSVATSNDARRCR